MLHKIKQKIISDTRHLMYRLKQIDASLLSSQYLPYAGEKKDYHKFVLVSHQRSGSTMLIKSLSSHPQVIAHLELFLSDRIDFHYNDLDTVVDPKTLYIRDQFPIEFLNKLIFRGYETSIQAVGFKMFPETMNLNRFKSVWDWLNKDSSIKIIYLKRDNLLAVFTSLMVATKSGYYSIEDKKDRSKLTVTID
jgi:LPS sulfotransferase NodH